MSVLDLDYYKLTMLQFIWKHYAEVPVTFRLHSRKQHLGDVVHPLHLQRTLDEYRGDYLRGPEIDYLRSLEVFEEEFIRDLARLFSNGMPEVTIGNPHTAAGEVSVSGDWFKVSLRETVVLSAVSERYSVGNIDPPDHIKRAADIHAIGESGARWADFGTRRRWSRVSHENMVSLMANWGGKYGFIGTSNVDLARRHLLRPIGTYAHELEMVLRNYFATEFDTTRDVLTKWQELYPKELRIALTDTYTTPRFLDLHGRFLLENDWRGVRLDSGKPVDIANMVDEWLGRAGARWDVVFSDGLDADTIINLQTWFSTSKVLPPSNLDPMFGWGTGLTNPNSDLSLVMKAVESNGQPTYKLTDDESKSIR